MLKPTDNSLTVTAAKASPAIVDAIRQASSKTGVDFAYLLENAATESSLNANAKASTSSAQGLYQFIESTWLETVDKHGAEFGLGKAAAAITQDSKGNYQVANPAARREILAMRNDPRIASLMAAELTQDNKAMLEQSLGREVNNTELYLAHFLGASGASRMLSKLDSNPNSKAAQVLPTAAQSNQNVFYQSGKAVSVNELYQHFAEKFVDSPTTSAIANHTDKAATLTAERPAFAATSNQNVSNLPVAQPFTRAATSYEYSAPATSLPFHQLPQLAFNLLRSRVLPRDEHEQQVNDPNKMG